MSTDISYAQCESHKKWTRCLLLFQSTHPHPPSPFHPPFSLLICLSEPQLEHIVNQQRVDITAQHHKLTEFPGPVRVPLFLIFSCCACKYAIFFNIANSASRICHARCQLSTAVATPTILILLSLHLPRPTCGRFIIIAMSSLYAYFA